MSPQKTKKRCIERKFESFFFKPRAIPLSKLEIIELTHDELEAVRLIDIEGLDQTQASTRMNISRGTIQRILTRARNKITSALVEGKAIEIKGGNYILGNGGRDVS